MASSKSQLLTLHGYDDEELTDGNYPTLILRSEPEAEAISFTENILNRCDRHLRFTHQEYSVERLFTRYTIAENGYDFLHLIVIELVKRQAHTAKHCAIQATNWVKQNYRSLGLVNVLTRTADIFSEQEFTRWGPGVAEVILIILKGWSLKTPIDGLASNVYSLEYILRQLPRADTTFTTQAEQIEAIRSFKSPSKTSDGSVFSAHHAGSKPHYSGMGISVPYQGSGFGQRNQGHGSGKHNVQKHGSRSQVMHQRPQGSGRQPGGLANLQQVTPRTSYAWPYAQRRQNEPHANLVPGEKPFSALYEPAFLEHKSQPASKDRRLRHANQLDQTSTPPNYGETDFTAQSGYSTTDSTQQSQHDESSKEETDYSSITSDNLSQVNITPSNRQQSAFQRRDSLGQYESHRRLPPGGLKHSYFRSSQRLPMHANTGRPGYGTYAENTDNFEGLQPLPMHSGSAFSSPSIHFHSGLTTNPYETVESMDMIHYAPQVPYIAHQIDPSNPPIYHPVFGSPYASTYPYVLPYPPPPQAYYGYPTPDSVNYSPRVERLWNNAWSGMTPNDNTTRRSLQEQLSHPDVNLSGSLGNEQTHESWQQLKEWQSALPSQTSHGVRKLSIEPRPTSSNGLPHPQSLNLEPENSYPYRGSSTTTVTFEDGHPSTATRVLFDGHRQPVSTATATFGGGPIAATAGPTAQPQALGSPAFPLQDYREQQIQYGAPSPRSHQLSQQQQSTTSWKDRQRFNHDQYSHAMQTERFLHNEQSAPLLPSVTTPLPVFVQTSTSTSGSSNTTIPGQGPVQSLNISSSTLATEPPISAVGPSFGVPPGPASQQTPLQTYQVSQHKPRAVTAPQNSTHSLADTEPSNPVAQSPHIQKAYSQQGKRGPAQRRSSSVG